MKPRGQGEQIRYTVGGSPLGPLLVARTAAGLCAVAFADTVEALRLELQGRYPEAHLHEAPGPLQPDLDTLLGGFASQDGLPELPWDLDCTPFQATAWRAMQRIARGETRTYGELAAQLGLPGGQIAVGQACARNPLALVIPCHRVLAHGNRPHHWRWGLERKVALLASERSPGTPVEVLHPPVQAELF